MEPIHVFINQQLQTFAALKSSLLLSVAAGKKFDVVNSHIFNTVVLPGELVIVGDSSVPQCTVEESWMMQKAAQVHQRLAVAGLQGDEFMVENYDTLQRWLSGSSIGVGVVTDGWSRHLNAIQKTLEDIQTLHQKYLIKGGAIAREEYYKARRLLFVKLDSQLESIASFGSGINHSGKIKKTLGISTRSLLKGGDIAGYADTVSGVAKASQLIKKGTWIGMGMTATSSALDIREACTAGQPSKCKKAKYVQGSRLVGNLGMGAFGGYAGGVVASGICVALGAASGGALALGCAVIGGAAGGWGGGEVGGWAGESMGEIYYERMSE